MNRVVLIGDSQAVGVLSGLEEALPALGYRIVGASVEEGWTTRRMAQDGRVAELVRETRPDLALVVLGGNDTAGPALVDAIAQLRLELSPTKRVLWIGPAHSTETSVARRHAGVAYVQSQYAGALAYVWLDGAQMTKDLAHAGDGVHFTRASQTTWARRIAQAVRRTEPRDTVRILLTGLLTAGAILTLGRYAR